jgi:hypothetical protein
MGEGVALCSTGAVSCGSTMPGHSPWGIEPTCVAPIPQCAANCRAAKVAQPTGDAVNHVNQAVGRSWGGPKRVAGQLLRYR